MRRLARSCLVGVLLLAGLFFIGRRVGAWSIGKSPIPIPGYLNPLTNAHGQIARRAMECLLAKNKPVLPPLCPTRTPLNLPVLWDALEKGAIEPDLSPRAGGDGPNNSKHSWNSRFPSSRKDEIARVAGLPDAYAKLLVPGKADKAREKEEDDINLVIAALKANLCFQSGNKQQEFLFDLWLHLGRLSHYLADVHSPFHPNSFGIDIPADPDQDLNDYYEGAVGPPAGNGGQWFNGFWLGAKLMPSKLEHAQREDWMGAAANIPTIACSYCFGPKDIPSMADEAHQMMDRYRGVHSSFSGYYAMVVDHDRALPQIGGINQVQINGWGPSRAQAAIGSIRDVFEDLLGDLSGPACPPWFCPEPTGPPGGDQPDDNASNALLTPPAGADVDAVIAAFHRLAAKKGKPRMVGLDLIHTWYGEATFGDMPREREEQYQAALAYRPDHEGYYHDYLTSPDAAVLANGMALDASNLIENRFAEPIRRVLPEALGPDTRSDYPVLVIPTGGLYGLSQDEQFKGGLESYVHGGGTAIVFSQQHGSDFSVLPTPDGRPIHAYGWLEDNSCFFNAAHINTFHPILAAQSSSLVTSTIDGYFDDIPAESIVLLRRVKNGLPAMFMYPYGAGWVIVSSSYDDWGGYNQYTTVARAIIRDAIAWAKKPADLPLNPPGSTVSITLHIANHSPISASQARLILMSPSRDRQISERTVSAAVPTGGSPM